MTPFFRDWTKLTTPTVLIPDQALGTNIISNCFEVRAENRIGTTYFAFTEDALSGTVPQGSGQIGEWTSTSLRGPWTYIGPAVSFAANTWKDNQLYCPSCVEIPLGGGLWYLFYCASDTSNNFSIGYATSSTPLVNTSWVDFGSNPVISGNSQADPFVQKNGSQYVMYMAWGYPGSGFMVYYTSPTGVGATWSFGATFMPAPGPTDWWYPNHSAIEPTVWFNKYCFWECIWDLIDEHNGFGQGFGSNGYGISADGLTWNWGTKGYGLPALFGLANPRIVQQDGLLYVFTDMFPDQSRGDLGGTGLSTIPDVP